MSVFLGDGSFEDCAQLGVFAEMSEGDLNTLYLEKGYFAALSNTSVPAVVVDYVGSVVRVFDTRFSGWCSVSDTMVAERLRRDYVGDEIVSRGTAYAFSECFASLGKKLYHYKLFEKTGVEGRIDRGAAYANHNVRMHLSREWGVGVKALGELANSVEPVDFVVENFDVAFEMISFENVFFNKNLSFDDVFRLWDLMSVEEGGNFLGFRHVSLLQSVLLRDDWSEDELRFFFEWWNRFSSVLDEQLVDEELRNEFCVLRNSVRILFASNVSAPIDLLLNLFESGDESVRIAVVRNSAVGKDFVSDVVNGGVIDSSVVRENALLSSAWGFEKLAKVFEDENESVGARFAALFNVNVPPFYRELYSFVIVQ